MASFNELYEAGAAADAKADVLIHHLYGAIDAGNCGRLALAQICETLPSRRVATFCSDELIDYRARRPSMGMDEWVLTRTYDPTITLDLVEDYQGNNLLVLTGPEPDWRWQQFAATVQQLAAKAGVKQAVNLMGMPATIPHTRTTFVHHMSAKPSLIPRQPKQKGRLQLGASMDMYLESYMGRLGMDAQGLIVGVPYYLADDNYPPAAVALIDRLSQITNLSLPVGDVEAQASLLRMRVDSAVAESDELAKLVADLEAHWDETWEGPTSDPTELAPPGCADDLADSLQHFLAKNDAARIGEWGGFGAYKGHPIPRHDRTGAEVDYDEDAPAHQAAGQGRSAAASADQPATARGQGSRSGAAARDGAAHTSACRYPPRANRRRS